MAVEFRLLGPGDEGLLAAAAAGVFDHDPDPGLSKQFLDDPRHHLAVAVDGGAVVGFASGVHYVHPDKPPELWINEVGVAPTHQRQGIGQNVLRLLLGHGRALGCREAWVLTSPANRAAMGLYAAAGGRRLSDPPAMFTFPLASTPRE